MTDANIREFATRPRDEVAAARREHWAALHRSQGPAATVRVGQELWHHMRQLRPDWPSEQERSADLAHHVELKRRLDAAAHARAA